MKNELFKIFYKNELHAKFRDENNSLTIHTSDFFLIYIIILNIK
jgi:hypothetical protein